VVAELQAQAEVEVYGIGVGLDLSPYYRQSLALDLSHSVTQAVLREIVAMLTAGPRR
jgi:cobaltochelatase CobT